MPGISRPLWLPEGGLGFHYELYPNVTVGINEKASLRPQHLSELAEDIPC